MAKPASFSINDIEKTLMKSKHPQNAAEFMDAMRKRRAQAALDNVASGIHYSQLKKTHLDDYVPLTSLAYPTPAPSDYYPTFPPGIQYSVVGKPNLIYEEKQKVGPGPYKYNTRDAVQAILKSIPEYTMGMRLKEIKFTGGIESNPSPLEYDTSKVIGKDAPSAPFTGARFDFSYNWPSPNKYVGVKKDVDGPKYTIRLHNPLIAEEKPGPSDYNVPHVLPNASTAPKFTMRPFLDRSIIPKDESVHPTFNTYSPKMERTGAIPTIKGPFQPLHDDKIPGPANYTRPTLPEGPKFTMIARSLAFGGEEFIPDYPSPLEYHPNFKLAWTESPTYTIGARVPLLKDERIENPGPGTYKDKTGKVEFNNAVKITLKGRIADIVDEKPSPAQYNVEESSKSIATGGQYRVHMRPSEEKTTEPMITPGPSDYEVLSAYKKGVKHAPNYTVRKRLTEPKRDHVPAPNTYDARDKLKGGNITFKGRPSPYVIVFPQERMGSSIPRPI